MLETGTWTVEAQSRDGKERAMVTRFVVLWRPVAEPEVPLALRPICKVHDSPADRNEFVSRLAPGSHLRRLDPPEVAERTHPLAEIVGETLIQVWFVSNYVQLHFQPGGTEPIPRHRSPLTCETAPLLRLPADGLLDYGERGYADGLVSLIGEHVTGVDEYLDDGLTIDFEHGAVLSIPLGPVDDWHELATFSTPHWLRVWMPGEAPFRREDRVDA